MTDTIIEIVVNYNKDDYNENGYYDNDYYNDKKMQGENNNYKIICNYKNINIIGNLDNNVGEPTETNDDLQAIEEEDPIGAEGPKSLTISQGFADKNKLLDNDPLVDCKNSNNIRLIQQQPTGNQEPEEPGPEETATLKVIKDFDCRPSPQGSEIAQGICDRLEKQQLPLTAEAFLFAVSGNNPDPNFSFNSATGTNVTLGAGNYQVSEPESTLVDDTLEVINREGGFILEFVSDEIEFSGDCGFSGSGTIAEGETQTCIVENLFIVELEN
jgi:hypothetical protein